MKKNITNKILMVRPVSFAFNEQTAVNNHYQKLDNKPAQEIQNNALIEFDNMVEKLKKMGIDVKVMQDTKEPHTPDSIFPNNWFSTHYSNTVVLYPMFAENRRLERTDNLYDFFDKTDDLNVVDYSSLENENIFLEGTGSLVLDRKNKKAYCSLSQRAHEKLLDIFCEDAGYKKIAFHSYQTVAKLFLALMQGEQAETSIIEALDKIYSHMECFDLLVIIRGGGAVTDLACFD